MYYQQYNNRNKVRSKSDIIPILLLYAIHKSIHHSSASLYEGRCMTPFSFKHYSTYCSSIMSILITLSLPYVIKLRCFIPFIYLKSNLSEYVLFNYYYTRILRTFVNCFLKTNIVKYHKYPLNPFKFR